MTDVEVGLVRAMLARGMKNDQIHFYFNRADRLISSGRITQIKDGSYAKDVAAASDDELTAFMAKWDVDHAANRDRGAALKKICSRPIPVRLCPMALGRFITYGAHPTEGMNIVFEQTFKNIDDVLWKGGRLRHRARLYRANVLDFVSQVP